MAEGGTMPSLVADCVTAANKAIDMRHWLTEGRGPYEWNDDRWHDEFYAAAKEIKEALAPMTKVVVDWSNCPMDAAAVVKARLDLKAERDAALKLVGELRDSITALVRARSEAQKSTGEGKKDAN
jgi:hypothetical protein